MENVNEIDETAQVMLMLIYMMLPTFGSYLAEVPLYKRKRYSKEKPKDFEEGDIWCDMETKEVLIYKDGKLLLFMNSELIRKAFDELGEEIKKLNTLLNMESEEIPLDNLKLLNVK